MKFRDALKFSLDLFLPEKTVLAVERLMLDHHGEANCTLREPPAPEIGEADRGNKARGMIEALDSSQFGGPSFGPQTIALMSQALDETLAMLPQPVADDFARTIAAAILKIAAEGERDPVRLQTYAITALKLDATTTIEAQALSSELK